ncbi:DNA damage-binding protein 1a, partial [Rhizophlyctis rosea]
LEDLHTISLTILHHPSPKPILAILTQDTKETRYLKHFIIDTARKELIPYVNLPPVVCESGATFVIPVPEAVGGGLLVVGEGSVMYVCEGGGERVSVGVLPTVFKCYEQLDEEGTRYLLGDYLGGLHVLVLFSEGGSVRSLRVQKLGEVNLTLSFDRFLVLSPAANEVTFQNYPSGKQISTPSSITYLDAGHVYIGSHFGDSQLISLRTTPILVPSFTSISSTTTTTTVPSYINLLQEFTNLAPILDFVVTEPEQGGQGMVVACCGAGKDGTLRVVRNGVQVGE